MQYMKKHCFKLNTCMLIFGFSPLNMIHFLDCNCVFVVIIILSSYFNINSYFQLIKPIMF